MAGIPRYPLHQVVEKQMSNSASSYASSTATKSTTQVDGTTTNDGYLRPPPHPVHHPRSHIIGGIFLLANQIKIPKFGDVAGCNRPVIYNGSALVDNRPLRVQLPNKETSLESIEKISHKNHFPCDVNLRHSPRPIFVSSP